MHALTLLTTLTLMGRPMISEQSVAQLTESCSFALEVEAASPFTATRKNKEGCEEKLWRVVVKETIVSGGSADKQEPPKAGTTIEVIVNPTELFDCMIRKTNPNGASFSAPRHTPAASEPGPRFLLFVNKGTAGYMITAQNGWDVLEKRPEVTRQKTEKPAPKP
ncbi:MAG: hypothetical protein JNM17_05560 [Archangium sp.]|nr:hypothetical protein [Archangium sp.]